MEAAQGLQFDLFGGVDDVVVWEAAPPMMTSQGWQMPESAAFAAALKRGSLGEALGVLNSLKVGVAAKVLLETGFTIGGSATRAELMAPVQRDLLEAVRRRMTGHELRAEQEHVGTTETQEADVTRRGVERSDTVESLNREIESLRDVKPFTPEFDRFLEVKKLLAEGLARELPDGVVLGKLHGTGMRQGAMISREPDNSGKWRVSWFDERGFSGDGRRDSYQAAILEALTEGYRDTNRQLLDELGQLESFHAGNAATMAIREENERQAQTAPERLTIHRLAARWAAVDAISGRGKAVDYGAAGITFVGDGRTKEVVKNGVTIGTVEGRFSRQALHDNLIAGIQEDAKVIAAILENEYKRLEIPAGYAFRFDAKHDIHSIATMRHYQFSARVFLHGEGSENVQDQLDTELRVSFNEDPRAHLFMDKGQRWAYKNQSVLNDGERFPKDITYSGLARKLVDTFNAKIREHLPGIKTTPLSALTMRPGGDYALNSIAEDRAAAPAKTAEEAIPQRVKQHLMLLLAPAVDTVAALSRARQTDVQFRGEGRYAAEVWMDREDSLAKMNDAIKNTLEGIPDLANREMARQYLAENMPDVNLTAQEKGYFQETARSGQSNKTDAYRQGRNAAITGYSIQYPTNIRSRADKTDFESGWGDGYGFRTSLLSGMETIKFGNQEAVPAIAGFKEGDYKAVWRDEGSGKDYETQQDALAGMQASEEALQAIDIYAKGRQVTNEKDHGATNAVEAVSMELLVKVAADSIGELRKVDVLRVLESNHRNVELAQYIAKERPDLAKEVDEVMVEEFGLREWKGSKEKPILVTADMLVTKGRFVGAVTKVTDQHVIQDVGRGKLVAHERSAFDVVPVVDAMMTVGYKSGRVAATSVVGPASVERGR